MQESRKERRRKMRKVILASMCALLIVFCIPTFSNALSWYNDRATFESMGTIVENYGYEDFGTGFSFPGDPWTAHGVTYTTGDNLIIGTATGYNPISNVFANNQWNNPVTGDIDTGPQYDMFGLDLAYLGASNEIRFTLFSPSVTHIIEGIFAPHASASQDFWGFIADPGRYFTGFRLDSTEAGGSAPVIDNVTLGNTTPIPEPTTMLLVGTGLLGLAGWRKKGRK
jgi:hypothetical protein